MKVLNLADKEVTRVIAKKQRAEMKGNLKKKMKPIKPQEGTSLEELEMLLTATDKPKKKKKVKLLKEHRPRKNKKKGNLSNISLEACGVEEKVVQQAIEGVRLLEAKSHSDSKAKKNVLEDDEEETILYLQVGMMKVTKPLTGAKHLIRPVKIKVFLPNPVVNESTNVLLITKDSEDSKDIRSDHSENLHNYQHMLRKSGAAKHISEVLTLKQLKTEYKEYEGKRMLANRSDVVLCDSTVFFRVPLFLGKHFFAKGKCPMPINLKAKNLLREVERCLSCEVLVLPMTGTCGLMKIGRLGQSNEKLMENIKVALRVMKSNFPGGWGNIKALNLKTKTSKSVPLYINLKSQNSIQPLTPKPISIQPRVTGELTTIGGHIYTVEPDNSIKVIAMGKQSEQAILRKEKKERKIQEAATKAKRNAKKSMRKKEKKKAAANAGKQQQQDDDAVTNGAEQQQDDDAVTNGAEQQQDEDANANVTNKSKKKKKKNKQQGNAADVEGDEAGSAKKKQKLGNGVNGDISSAAHGLEKESGETAPKEKAPKSKKKKKKIEKEKELDINLDLDSDDDNEINKIEMNYLKKLNQERNKSEKSKVKSKKKVTSDEYDDWAEDSDDDMDDMESGF